MTMTVSASPQDDAAYDPELAQMKQFALMRALQNRQATEQAANLNAISSLSSGDKMGGTSRFQHYVNDPSQAVGAAMGAFGARRDAGSADAALAGQMQADAGARQRAYAAWLAQRQQGAPAAAAPQAPMAPQGAAQGTPAMGAAPGTPAFGAPTPQGGALPNTMGALQNPKLQGVVYNPDSASESDGGSPLSTEDVEQGQVISRGYEGSGDYGEEALPGESHGNSLPYILGEINDGDEDQDDEYDVGGEVTRLPKEGETYLGDDDDTAAEIDMGPQDENYELAKNSYNEEQYFPPRDAKAPTETTTDSTSVPQAVVPPESDKSMMGLRGGASDSGGYIRDPKEEAKRSLAEHEWGPEYDRRAPLEGEVEEQPVEASPEKPPSAAPGLMKVADRGDREEWLLNGMRQFPMLRGALQKAYALEVASKTVGKNRAPINLGQGVLWDPNTGKEMKSEEWQRRMEMRNQMKEEYANNQFLHQRDIELSREMDRAKTREERVAIAKEQAQVQRERMKSNERIANVRAGAKVKAAGTIAGAIQGNKLPADVRKSIVLSRFGLEKVKRIEGLLNGNPNAVGFKGFVPQIWLNRMDRGGVAARAAIAELGSMWVHERSGAAVTASEYPRLKPFIPEITDDIDTLRDKLKNFAEIYRDEQRINEGIATEMLGAKPSGGENASQQGGEGWGELQIK
jgi:hypothetical protein